MTDNNEHTDIMTFDRWLDMIFNNGEATFHHFFLYIAARYATPQQLEHMRTAYPLLVDAIEIKAQTHSSFEEKINSLRVNKNKRTIPNGKI